MFIGICCKYFLLLFYFGRIDYFMVLDVILFWVKILWIRYLVVGFFFCLNLKNKDLL